MKIAFEESAWEEFIGWQSEDRKMVKRINILIKDIERNGPDQGLGKPERLQHNLAGMWSRRIDQANRLVYSMDKDQLKILSCKGHYS